MVIHYTFDGSRLRIDRLLVGVAGVLQRVRLGYSTIFTFRRLVVFSAAFKAAAMLHTPVYLFLLYKFSFVTTLLLLVV